MISVLCVDDETPLCELAKRMLEETKEFTVDTAGSAEEALAKVNTTSYDVIVSDYQMNGMDGIAFLKALRSSGSKIPFIICVDTSRKEVIISAFENGADFYIGKDGDVTMHFAELAHKIRAAVRHRRSEEKYRAYTEHSPVGIFVVDQTGRYVDVNPAACRMLGYSRSEFLDLSITDITPADRVALELERFSCILLQTGEMSVESLLKKKDGTIITVILDATRLPDDTFMAYCTDITDLKHTEEKLLDSNRMLGIALRAAKAGTWDWDFPTGILTWSPEFFELFGLPPDAPPSFETWLSVLHRDDRGPAMAKIDQSVREHAFLWNEYRIILPDGTVRWIGAAGSTIYDDTGEPLRMSGVCIDISTRKQAETAVRESEALLKRTGKIARVGGWELDAETRAVSWTEETFHIHEVPVGQTPPLEDAINFFHPDERSRLTDAIRNALETGEGYDMELQFITARGKHLWTRSICEPEVIGGKTIRLIGTFQDITERKKAEEALRESEERFRGVVETSPIGIAAINPATQRFTLANPGFMQITGYTQDELCKMTVQDITHPDDIQREKDLLKEYFDSHAEVFEIIKRYIRKDGAIRVVQVIGKMITTQPGDDPVAIANVLDITERKAAENALAESELQYRMVVENAYEGIVVAQDGLVKFANPGVLKMTGLPLERMVERPFTVFIHPDDRELVSDRYQRRVRGENVPTFYDFRVLREDGRITWVQISSVLMSWKGRPATLNFLSDITERKEVELQLRAAQEHLEEAHRLAHIGTWKWDIATDRVTWSQELYAIAGRDPTQPVPGWAQHPGMFTPASWERLSPAVSNTIQTGEPYHLDLEMVRPDGTIREVSVLAGLQRNVNGQVTGLYGLVQDISDRKQAERMIQESEKKYRNLVRNISDVLFTINTDGIITYISPVVCQFGIADRDVQGRPFLDFIVPDDYEIVQKAVSDVLSGEDVTVEFRVRNPAGVMFHVHVSARPEMNARNVTGIACIMTNITSKKELERLKVEALQQIEENLVEMAVLNDQIRNPLAVIMAAADLTGGSAAEDIIRQVQEIDSMINKIDRKWVESEKVREFLKKYYGVGG
ncbi:MAG: putative diguanylate cyclase [Methanoregulaceae archaeon PtaB.Bin108]|nr:MAG: putative diguanylate cyclase [Methanoregulaceae archaeon PtaB.Bin108]